MYWFFEVNRILLFHHIVLKLKLNYVFHLLFVPLLEALGR